MITSPKKFPQDRRADPKRRAEAIVFATLADCQRAGHVIYEWGATERPHRTDFAVWLEGVARFAIEVKGGQYSLDGDQWHLRTPDGGLETKSSPLHQADDAAMDLRNEIHRNTGYKAFIIPVVVFTDMAPDPVIEQYAQRTNVKLIWGAEHLLTDLETAARRVGIDHPPRANHIQNEVRAVTGGADAEEGEGARRGEPRSEADAAPTVEQLELSAGAINVTIHHVDNLVFQQSPDPMPNCGF